MRREPNETRDGWWYNGWGTSEGSGPNHDPFISHYTIPVSGTYYVAVSGYSSIPGDVPDACGRGAGDTAGERREQRQ